MASNEMTIPRSTGINLPFKLSRTAWLLLAGGIFAVVVAGLLVIRNQQAAEQQDLNQQLTAVNARMTALQLDQLTSQQGQLVQQNDQALQNLATLKQLVAGNIDSISGGEQLYNIARECGVTITNLGASADAPEKFAGVNTSALPMTATVEGDWNKLLDFIYRIKSEFTTCLIESADLRSVPESAQMQTAGGTTQLPEGTASSPSTTSPAKTNSPSLNIKFSIYTYKGK